MLNKEEHVKDIAFFTTLAGFIHWKLTGEKVLGVGDASGMFPIDSNTKDYDAAMLDKFDVLAEPYGFDWSLRDILPKVLVAGENAGTLTAEGARLLDTDGELEAGIPVCLRIFQKLLRQLNTIVSSLKVEAGKTATLNVSDVPKVTETLVDLFKIDM